MKEFYSQAVEPGGARHGSDGGAPIPTRARIAVYDATAAAPRVEEVGSHSVDEYIETLSARVYELAKTQGGAIPYTVVREVSENLIHADFAEPVVSVLDGGRTIRFADQGPGITNKKAAVLPGFTTASGDMKRHIRGVGSGLPIVRDFLSVSGGSLVIEDNLGCGAVVTICSELPETTPAPRTAGGFAPALRAHEQTATADMLAFEIEDVPEPVARPRLSTRQKQVLALVMESGSAGPSIVSRELGVGISTAYRDLASLEDLGLISADGGKRHLTTSGMTYLNGLTQGL